MKYKSYIIVSHQNGKRRVFTVERYRLLRGLKIGLAIAAAIGVMLLMCGMVLYDDSPAVPLQLIVMLGIGLLVLIALIYSYVSDKEPCENQGSNKNSNFRRKAK